MSESLRITGVWGKTTFVCGCHKEPVKMVHQTGQSGDFYACPRYFLKDMMHPDGHEPDEPMCMNRMSFSDSVKVIEACIKKSEEEFAKTNVFPSFLGLRGKLSNGIEYVVTRDDPASFDRDARREITVNNKRAPKRW